MSGGPREIARPQSFQADESDDDDDGDGDDDDESDDVYIMMKCMSVTFLFILS